MKLTLVIEAAKGSDIVQKVIGWMQRRQLSEIIEEPEIVALYEPLYKRHLENKNIIQAQATQKDGVVFFDLAGYDVEGYNKFIPYYLFPDAVYTVVGKSIHVSHQDFRRLESVDEGDAQT
ncbi:MAG: hypothetical protein WDO73_20650 [Ignavibacteriota bacterium]